VSKRRLLISMNVTSALPNGDALVGNRLQIVKPPLMLMLMLVRGTTVLPSGVALCDCRAFVFHIFCILKIEAC
jgi:hypothetical protein